MKYDIKIGSVTNAQRGSKALRLAGIKTNINRIEKPTAGDGCGFVLRVDAKDKENAISVLKKNVIRILGVNSVDIL